MLYVAEYIVSSEQKQKIVAAIASTIKQDGYYPMYPRDGGSVEINGQSLNLGAGSNNVARSSAGGHWGEWAIHSPQKWSGVKAHHFYGWATCAGNVECIEKISENRVRYTRKGARHGITDFFRGVFQGVVPLKIIKYDSWRTDACPFGRGLATSKREEVQQEYINRKVALGISKDAALRQFWAER